MATFHYEWWTVDVTEPAGRVTLEFKARSKAHAIRQIEKEVAISNSNENASRPWWDRMNPILEVYWDTLTLDRTGYQRRF